VADAFTDRLARVRQRFASTIESKIEDTYEALPSLMGGAAAAAAVADTYRRIHGICGVADTVGFIGTGRAARKLDMIIAFSEEYRADTGGRESARLSDMRLPLPPSPARIVEGHFRFILK
jgi:hypothetical protein